MFFRKTMAALSILLFIASFAFADPWPCMDGYGGGYVGAGGDLWPSDGGYEIDPGGTVTLSGGFISGIYMIPNFDGGSGSWIIDDVWSTPVMMNPGTNNTPINVSGPTFSYDDIVTGLGLSHGPHTITLSISVLGRDNQTMNFYDWSGSDTVSLNITPEPATLLLVGFGALGLLRKRNR